MNVNWGTLLPIIIYFVLMYFIGVYAMRIVAHQSRKKGGGGEAYLEEYMTGGRGTGGLCCHDLVATYLSAGGFIGGPSLYTALPGYFLPWRRFPRYYTLMVLGKKFAIVSRKINAQSISDFAGAL